VDDYIKQTEGEEEKDITEMVQKQWEKIERKNLKDKMLKLRGKDPTMKKDDLKYNLKALEDDSDLIKSKERQMEFLTKVGGKKLIKHSSVAELLPTVDTQLNFF
jgi:hypothetical protein